jgi:hypothetical protein
MHIRKSNISSMELEKGTCELANIFLPWASIFSWLNFDGLKSFFWSNNGGWGLLIGVDDLQC